MKSDWLHGAVGLLAVALATVAYGQQSTPPPATDFAPAAPGSTSASPTTDTAAPAAGVTSGAGAATGALDDRANEQSAAAASPASTNATSSGTFPAPMPRTGSPLDQQLGSGVAGGGAAANQAAGQRGELGVWLVETGGPGVRVRRITEGSAADLAGLQPGDVILGINGRGTASPQTVAQLIREMPAGQTANVQFWRDGQTREMQIVLQPAREQYEVGFRGGDSVRDMGRANGDLESRVMRLEQQLAALVQELRQLRELHHSGTGAASVGGGGFGETAPTTGVGTATAPDTSTTTTGAATTQPAAPATTTPDAGATEPAAEPATTPPPTTQPATGDDDLFGSSTTEQPAATEPPATENANPAADEATPEAAPATESSSDDLFE